MFSTNDISRLYSSVLDRQIRQHAIHDDEIRDGIQTMADIYRPRPSSLTLNDQAPTADYNLISHQCAYLHKYAPFHTAMVSDMLRVLIQQNRPLFQDLFSEGLSLCSLGGGPGTDVVGVLAAFNQAFGLGHSSAHVFDLMSGWEVTFESVVRELCLGQYGFLSKSFDPGFFMWSYSSANLLEDVSWEVKEAISSANLVTMVKFLSASACKDTEAMLQKIFHYMKPGALLLFIDNAGGGFDEIILKVARENQLILAAQPMKHFPYIKSLFNPWRFGYLSCYESKIAIQLFKKKGPLNRNSSFKHDQNFEIDSYASISQNHFTSCHFEMESQSAPYPSIGHNQEKNQILFFPDQRHTPVPSQPQHCFSDSYPFWSDDLHTTTPSETNLQNSSNFVIFSEHRRRPAFRECNRFPDGSRIPYKSQNATDIHYNNDKENVFPGQPQYCFRDSYSSLARDRYATQRPKVSVQRCRRVERIRNYHYI